MLRAEITARLAGQDKLSRLASKLAQDLSARLDATERKMADGERGGGGCEWNRPAAQEREGGEVVNGADLACCHGGGAGRQQCSGGEKKGEGKREREGGGVCIGQGPLLLQAWPSVAVPSLSGPAHPSPQTPLIPAPLFPLETRSLHAAVQVPA